MRKCFEIHHEDTKTPRFWVKSVETEWLLTIFPWLGVFVVENLDFQNTL